MLRLPRYWSRSGDTFHSQQCGLYRSLSSLFFERTSFPSSFFLPVFSSFNSRWSRWIKDEKKTRVSTERTIITICFLSHAIRYVTERTDAFFVLSLLQLGWLFRSMRNSRCNEKRFTSYQVEFIFYYIFSIYVYIFDCTAAWTTACVYVKFIYRDVAKVF